MKTTSSLWESISILVGAVLAVLALIRGTLQLPLLLLCFAVWGAWVIFKLLFPAWRSIQELSRQQKRTERQREILNAASYSNDILTDKLLHHVNCRITSSIKAVYPNARWEWILQPPVSFVTQGGTVRIRVYGIPDFDFANVTLDSKNDLSCTLVKTVSLSGEKTSGKNTSENATEAKEEAKAPNQQAVDPQVWYDLQGQKILEQLISDLNARGHNKLYLREDGSICTQSEDGTEDMLPEILPCFPQKVHWSKLKDVLEQAGLAATVEETHIQVAW